MHDETHNPLSPFFAVADGLAQLAADPELIFLAETGKQQGRISWLKKLLDELAEIQLRADAGETQEGDAFRSIRLISRLPKSDLVRILIELGLPNDDDALLPWRADLKKRKPSRHDKLTAQIADKVDKRFDRQRRQDAIVKRVTLVRINRECSLPEALEIVAKGTDLTGSGLLSHYLKPMVRSVAAVRADFMAGMKRNKAKGYVEYKANALIGGGYRKLYFGDLVKKGRRPNPK